MKKVVYLVGPPCTGKTTLRKEWEKGGGAGMPEFLDPVPDFVVNAWQLSKEEQLSGQMWVLNQYLKKDKLIHEISYDDFLVVERSPLDAVVYARVLDKGIGDWMGVSVSQRSWQPGSIVLLTAGNDVLQQRWRVDRGISNSDWETHWAPFTDLLQKQYQHFADTFGFPIVSTETILGRTVSDLFSVMRENSELYYIENLVYDVPTMCGLS